MSTLYVAEFADIGGGGNFPVQAAHVPPLAEQTVAIGGSSTSCTNAFGVNSNFVRIQADATCSIAFGKTPVATTGTMRMAAGTTEYFSVPAGAGYKVAVISNS